MFDLKSGINNFRYGVLDSVHSKLETPFFMPVATMGSYRDWETN